MAQYRLREMWAAPRPPRPPARVWWDWVFVAALVAWSILEALLREDLAWRPLSLFEGVVVALSLLWRRTRPLGAVVAAFGALTVVELVRIFAAEDAGRLWSVVAVLLLPYALCRWGSGRAAVIGLVVVAVWLGATSVAFRTDRAEVVAAYGFFLFSAALGTSIRLLANARVRDVEEAKLRQRGELARELHDTVGHHVSAIAIQAQAGRVLSATDPARAAAVFETIEKAAARTLAEMRSMVGVLREGADPDLAPQPGVADIKRLAREVDQTPRIEVHLSGDFAGVSPSVGVALYRMAQESVTNALRHAQRATVVTVRVADEGDDVRLTVCDDGEAPTVSRPDRGYGLVGMAERAALLGGSLRAGPHPAAGWAVEAALPKGGAR